jgi:hypothetical protein
MKLLFLLFTTILMLATTVSGQTSSYYIYQENLTEYVHNYKWNTTDYPYTNVFDGNWSTYGLVWTNESDSEAIITFNYTKPLKSTNQTIVTSRYTTGGSDEIYNMTISDSWGSCWDYHPEKLFFRIYSRYRVSPALWYHRLYCSDGSWQQMYVSTNARVYEEAIWWHITKNESGLTLNATPGWTTTSNSITVTCDATEPNINMTLTRDGITVPNPYSATLDNGNYEFNCTINDTLNYHPITLANTLVISSESFACTNSSTYSFVRDLNGVEGDNITLNFTDLVANNLVKTDMSDIYTSRNAWINTTDGYFFTVNITGLNSISVYFGNFLGNNTYSTTPNSENVTNVTQYAQANSYYILTTMDEMNNEEQMPPDSNVSMTIYCDSGQSIFVVNETNILIPTFDDRLTGFRSTVSYPSDYYTRDYLVDNQVESRIIYDVDAYEFSVLQIPIYINDYNYFDAEITIYKRIDGEPVIITEGVFDNEHKFVAYLIRDEPYYIRLTTESLVREAGFFKPVAAETLTLNINSISVSPSIVYISDVISANAVNTSLSNIQVTYNDSSGETQSVRIKVFEDTNQTAFFDNVYSGVQSLSVAVSPVNMSTHYYSVLFEVTHATFGNSPVDFTFLVGAPVLWGIGTIGTWIYGIVGFIMMLFLSFMVTPKNRFVGVVMIMVGLSIMLSLTWTVLDPGILTLVVIFASVSIVYEIKRGGFT